MKRFLVFIFLIIFSSTSFAIAGDYTRHSSLEVRASVDDNANDRDLLRLTNQAGVSKFRVSETGNVYAIQQSSGNPVLFSGPDSVVLIDSYTDLSTWSNASSGQSYFQMEAGKTYIVDPHAIYISGADPAGATGFNTTAFSAVSAMLPLATSDTHLMKSKVIWATTGSAAGGSGLTEVQVWSAPSAGTTSYRLYDSTSQNMAGMMTSGSSVMSVAATTGARNINSYGETGTWMLLYNSAVSAIAIDRDYP